MIKIVHMYIRVSKELHARVKQEADDRAISMNTFVIEALNEKLSYEQIPLHAVEIDGEARYVLKIPPEKFLELIKDDREDS